MPNTAINQKHLINKINQYLTNRKLAPLFKEGACNGFVGLHSYMKAIGKENQYFDWITYLSNYTESYEIQEKKHIEALPFDSKMEKIIAYIRVIYSPDLINPLWDQIHFEHSMNFLVDSKSFPSLNKTEAKEKLIQHEITQSGIFNKKELELLIKDYVKQNRMIVLQSESHAIDISFNGNDYEIYDPNDHEIPHPLTLKQAAEKIIASFKNKANDYQPLNLFAFRISNTESVSYPNSVEWLNTIYNRTETAISLNERLRLVNKNNINATFMATAADENNILRYLIKQGADIAQASNKTLRTPLHNACALQNIDNVKLLLQNDSTTEKIINKKDKNNKTALHYAYEKENLELFNYLLQKNADINLSYQGYPTLLAHAIDKKNITYVKAILDHLKKITKNFDITQLTINNESLLHAAAASGSVEIFDYFYNEFSVSTKDKYKSANYLTTMDETPLITATKHGHVNIINELLLKPAKIDASNKIGYQAIHYAVINKHATALEALLAYDPTIVNAVDSYEQNTPLHLLFNLNNPSVGIIKILLESEASLCVKNQEGKTPFLLAIDNAAINKYIDLLLTQDLDKADLVPAIHICLRRGEFAAIDKILNYIEQLKDQTLFTEVYKLNLPSNNIFKSATQKTTRDLSIWLEHSNNLIKKTDEAGNTPLHYAVKANNIDAIWMLLRAGANPLQQNTISKKTPLQVAHDTHNKEIINLLELHNLTQNKYSLAEKMLNVFSNVIKNTELQTQTKWSFFNKKPTINSEYLKSAKMIVDKLNQLVETQPERKNDITSLYDILLHNAPNTKESTSEFGKAWDYTITCLLYEEKPIHDSTTKLSM
ncbi:MAG: hypothetical protein Tsb005_02290 [Gammaproteobacteria bacterium]